MRGKLELTLLNYIKLVANINYITTISHQQLHQNSESDSENMMGSFGHLIVISNQPHFFHPGVRIIHLMLLVFPHLMLLPVGVRVVWFIGPPTSTSIKFIVGLIMVILCHIRLVIIHPWAIPTKTGPMIHYLWVGMIILVFLVMVEVVLFIG